MTACLTNSIRRPASGRGAGLAVFLLVMTASCAPDDERRFTLLLPDHTNIHFENRVTDTPEFNILNYLYFYDGGGVAVGDINNNGLPDLFFVGNDDENKLYLNRGDFQFEDITDAAGVGGDPGSWSTGATMADVNGSGYLDIYVSRVNFLNKEGANQLFINNGDGTFTDRAGDYALDFAGYSTQGVFFDYNNSGRLDLFLLNHSFHSDRTYGRADILRNIQDPKAGDRLFRNDGDTFTDVTEESGIFSSALGYGLGVAISDITRNGWPDIYVGNDFHEDDYLYINNGDGTFEEALYSSIGHTSRSSMGNDIADVTNNGYLDIISLDMMPEDHETYMRSGGPDLYVIAQTKLDFGFGHKNERNTFQLNRGKAPDGTPVFSEIAFASGVARTEWSWAPLFFDINNNGWKDLYVTNGMVRRPNDLDYVRIRNMREAERRQTGNHGPVHDMALIDAMPEVRVPNYAFRNNGDLTFSNQAAEWGLAQPGFSSGAAYVDLNNNGRLDLVVNNVNMPAFIYRNNTPVDDPSAKYLKVKLNGTGLNTTGIGSRVMLYHGNNIFYQEQMPTRGFQSSVDHVLHFGLGGIDRLDSLVVVWPDNSYQTLHNIETDQLLVLSQNDTGGIFDYSRLNRSWDNAQFRNVTGEIGLDHRHRENDFNDFGREPLMPYKLSTQGPALAVGDVTGNGLDDIYLGGARWQAGRLYLQQMDGTFISSDENLFEADRSTEDVDAIFFDANANGLIDLYVVSGGGELTGNDPALEDRLYINTGNGRFEKSEDRLPRLYQNGSVVRAHDFNGNGHMDLFVGGRSLPYRYGISPGSYLLVNDGDGYFSDGTAEAAPDLQYAGMITDAQWAYINNSEYPDLVVAGEWMPLQLFRNDGSRLHPPTEASGLSDYSGLWQSIAVHDITGNGHLDIVAGNFGHNSRIQASQDAPFRLYVNDFEGNGQTAPVAARNINGTYYPFDQLDELLLQLGSLTRRVNSYRDYASKSMLDLFGREAIESSVVREITELGSLVFLNNGDGTFTAEELPAEAQFSPVKAIYVSDAGSTGSLYILLGGNLYDVKPGTGGRQDACYGVHLVVGETGAFKVSSLNESGFFVRGETRHITTARTGTGNILLVARNDESIEFFRQSE